MNTKEFLFIVAFICVGMFLLGAYLIGEENDCNTRGGKLVRGVCISKTCIK